MAFSATHRLWGSTLTRIVARQFNKRCRSLGAMLGDLMQLELHTSNSIFIFIFLFGPCDILASIVKSGLLCRIRRHVERQV